MLVGAQRPRGVLIFSGRVNVDRVPAAAAVGLREDERLTLQLACAVGRADNQGGGVASRQLEGALPADHAVGAGWRFDELGHLPRGPAVRRVLDLLNAAAAAVGDAG